MRWVLGAAAALVVLAGVAIALAAVGGGRDDRAALRPPEGPYRGSEPPAGIRLPRFALPDAVSRRLVRSRDLRGKVALVTFLDSQCTDACPVIASVVAGTLARLPPVERRRVEAVAFSTDPAEDTRASVRLFLRRRAALGALAYLVAPERELRPLWRAFQILPSAETGKDTLHSAPVRVYDPRGTWVSTLHAGVDLSEAALTHDVRVALTR